MKKRYEEPHLIKRAANTIDGNVFRGREFPWDPYVCISPGLCVYLRCQDKKFIEGMYPKLCKNAEFWRNYRMYDGLFYYDAVNKGEPSYLQNVKYESGWDDSVRWDMPIYELWAIDLNCFMVDYYNAMSYIASELGNGNDSEMWKKRAQELADLINERMWDEKQHCYVDVNKFTGEKSSVMTPASFMPLYSGIVSAERAEFMNNLASDKRKFYSGMPTVAYDNPEYSTTYWRGPTWLNVAYFAAKGLKNYGFSAGDDIKNTILDWCDKDKRGIFENYNSITGEGLRCDHFSWSSAFIIEFILDMPTEE